MIPAVDNIFILRGDSWSRSYSLFQGRPVVLSATAKSAVSVSITAKTQGMNVLVDAIPSGRKLWVGERVLTLSNSVEPGDTALTVTDVPWAIVANEVAYVLADLTGAVGRARITRGEFGISPAVGFGDDRLSGQVTVSLNAAQTLTMPASLSPDELQKLDDEALQNRVYGIADYTWDYDLAFPDGTVLTPFRGICLVGEDIAG